MREFLRTLPNRLKDIGQPKPWGRYQAQFEKLSPEDKAFVDALAQRFLEGTFGVEGLKSLRERGFANAERAVQQVRQNGGSLEEESRAFFGGLDESPRISTVFYRVVQMRNEPPTS